jgi:hypothetical protein
MAPAVRQSCCCRPCLALYQTRRPAWNETAKSQNQRAICKAQSKSFMLPNAFVGKHQAKFGGSLSLSIRLFSFPFPHQPIEPTFPISEPTLSCEFREQFVVQQLRSTSSNRRHAEDNRRSWCFSCRPDYRS